MLSKKLIIYKVYMDGSVYRFLMEPDGRLWNEYQRQHAKFTMKDIRLNRWQKDVDRKNCFYSKSHAKVEIVRETLDVVRFIFSNSIGQLFGK